jgi:hypothetical protein
MYIIIYIYVYSYIHIHTYIHLFIYIVEAEKRATMAIDIVSDLNNEINNLKKVKLCILYVCIYLYVY